MVLLFVLFRFMSILLFLPGGYLVRGQLDHGFYYSFAQLSARGYFPYVDYWMEYPPLFAWTLVGLYQLSTFLPIVGDGFFWSHTLVSLFSLPAETGCLVLVFLMAKRIYGHQKALRCSIFYALLFTPLFTLLGAFEAFPLFFLLLALYLVLSKRSLSGGVIAGIGFQIKLFPILVAPVAWRAIAGLRDRLRYLSAAVCAVLIIAVPLWLLNSTMLVASFATMATRASWETVWALLEGYYSFGKVAPLADRFSADTAIVPTHPSGLPWPIVEAAFLVLYALIWTRRWEPDNAKSLAALAGITINLALLASKGYSPQFLVYVLPFIVLLLPNLEGAVFAVLLGLIDYVEGVLYFAYFPGEHWLLTTTVLLRTTIVVALSLRYALAVMPQFQGIGAAIWRRGKSAGLAMCIVAPIASLALLAGNRVEQPARYAAAADYIRQHEPAANTIAVVADDVYAGIRRQIPDAAFWLPTAKAGEPSDALDADLLDFSQRHSQVWLVTDQSAENHLTKAVETWFRWHGDERDVRLVSGLLIRNYAFPATVDAQARVGRQLGASIGPVQLIGYDLTPREAAAGETVRLILYWRSNATSPVDYSVFVHMLDLGQRTIATGDRTLADETGLPLTRWQVGQLVRQAYEINVPLAVSPVDYQLEVGLYQTNGAREAVVTADGARSDRVLLEGPRVRSVSSRVPSYQHPLNARFSDRVLLAGYSVSGQSTPTGRLEISLYWLALRPMQEDYTVFLHLIDPSDKIAAQIDGDPLNGAYGTSRWQTGEVVGDTRLLVLPTNAPKGPYRLRLGMYLRSSGQRLNIGWNGKGADHVDVAIP